ncbi:hypothetical protein G7081_07075 [Vagococcus coleopterorum]|uniref:Mga helix-turn-helix domain-containing protein n=1 Tax=Vagococcus coleopterorum TaxID=2714946 RepID=A0A6G8AP43_9ENTE|nr:helix-turn-helix domain-containing protein [Vagococcus coleopterorum]QIL46848.1 hypothetical protein G7081_07075 [Vagococcus coleopterorum]
MLEQLLKKNEYKQVLILGLVNHKEQASKEAIQADLAITPATFSRYLRNINLDLEEIFPNYDVKIINNSDQLSLLNTHDYSPDHLFNKLVHHYLMESNMYRMLKSLLLRNSHQTSLLIEELNISQSYFNKLIKQLNTFIEPTGVIIAQRNKEIFFDGDEAKIIYLEYLMRHYFETIEPLPCICTHSFPTIEEVVRDHTIADLNDVQKQRMETLHHTFKKRYKQLHLIKIPDSELKEVLKAAMCDYDLLDDTVPIDDFNCDMRLYTNLLARISSSQLEDLETKREIGRRLIELDTPIVKNIVLFIDTICEKFIPNMTKNSREYAEFFYMVILHIAYIRLFGCNYKGMFQLNLLSRLEASHEDQPIYAEILDYFHTPDNFLYLDKEISDVILNHNSLFIDSCYTAVRSYRKTTVKVSFDFIYRLSFEFFLQNRLRQIFGDSMLEYVADSNEADIMISDHFISVSKETTLFTFIDTNSSETLNKLLNLITRTYTTKIMTVESNKEKASQM